MKMRRSFKILSLLSLFILLFAGTALADTYVVLFSDSVNIYSPQMSDQEAEEVTVDLFLHAGVDVSDMTFKHFYLSMNGFSADMEEKDALAIMMAFPDSAVNKDHIMKNAEYVEPEDALRASARASDYDPETYAWQVGRFERFLDWTEDMNPDYSKVIVFVMDSGCDLDHPDLAPYYDTSLDYDVVDTDYVADDCHGHGTNVAGLISAPYTGVCPGVTLVPIRVSFNDGGSAFAYFSDMVAGADYICGLVDGGALSDKNVIANLSYNASSGSRDTYCELMYSRVIYRFGQRGVLFFASAGNNGLDVDSNWIYPTKQEADNFVAVAAAESNGNLASFSDYGDRTVEISAPGRSILTCTWEEDEQSRVDKYDRVSGTSFSSPVAVALAAHIWALYPDIEEWQVRNVLIDATRGHGTEGSFVAEHKGTSPGYLGYTENIPVIAAAYQENEVEVIAGKNIYPEVVAGIDGPDRADCVSPSDESGGHGVDGVTLTWSYANKLDPLADVTFDVYFGTDPESLSCIDAGDNDLSCYWEGPFSNGQDLYWRIDVHGPYSEVTTGEVWTFRTLFGDTGDGAQNPAPANHTIDVPVDTVLDWTHFSESDGRIEATYDVYLNDSLIADGKTGSSCDPDLLHGTTYTWKVNSWVDGEFFEGTDWDFTTPDMAPENLYPESSATKLDISGVTLTWDCDEPNALFDVKVKLNDGIWQTLATDQTEKEYALSDLDYDETWSWQIVAKHGEETEASAVHTFSTLKLVPSLVEPVTGSRAYPLCENILQWDCEVEGTAFDVYFGDNQTLVDACDPSVQVESSTAGKVHSLPCLDESTTYYWKVEAFNGGKQRMGNTWSFDTTALGPEEADVLDPYYHGESVVVNDPHDDFVLEWAFPLEGASYDVYLCVSDDLVGSLDPQALVASGCCNKRYEPSVEPGNTYYWKVVAHFTNGDGPHAEASEEWAFEADEYTPTGGGGGGGCNISPMAPIGLLLALPLFFLVGKMR